MQTHQNVHPVFRPILASIQRPVKRIYLVTIKANGCAPEERSVCAENPADAIVEAMNAAFPDDLMPAGGLVVSARMLPAANDSLVEVE